LCFLSVTLSKGNQRLPAQFRKPHTGTAADCLCVDGHHVIYDLQSQGGITLAERKLCSCTPSQALPAGLVWTVEREGSV